MAARTIKSILFSCCFLILLCGCEKPGRKNSEVKETRADNVSGKSARSKNRKSTAAKFDVCELLRTDEIQMVTGSSIEKQQGSGRSNDGLRNSQCVYLASQPSQSVSLVVTQVDPIGPHKRSAKDFWRERFGRYRKNVEEEKEEAERGLNKEMEEREGRPPRKIEGIGDEAFWTAGSLYVLQGDAFLRMSIGGPESEDVKLEHSKALAAAALKRLSSL